MLNGLSRVRCRRPWCRLTPFSLIMLLCLSSRAEGQSVPYVVVGGSVGYLQRPYGGTCADEQSPSIGLYGGLGVSRSKMSAQLSYRHNWNVDGVSCTLDALVRQDGVYEVSRFEREAPKGLRAVIAEARYAPLEWLPLAVGIGVGVETKEADPLVSASVALSLWRGTVPVVITVQMVWLLADRNVYQEEWQDFRIISSTLVRSGSSWRRAGAVSMGFQVPLTVDR